MSSSEPVKTETGTDAEPRPPARVRYLAAATHVGFWFAFIPLYQAENAYLLHDVPAWVQAGLVLVCTFAPVVAAFVVARRSEWRSFLRAHAIAACAVHAAGAAAVLTISFLDPPRWDIPEALESALWTVSSVVLLPWAILPFGAAYRAKDGEMAWYPIVTRLMARGRGSVSP